jgi:hypothetical protein
MNEPLIDEICEKVRRGAKLYIGKDHTGRKKIKLVRGPFGLITERYDISDAALEDLKRRLASDDCRAA